MLTRKQYNRYDNIVNITFYAGLRFAETHGVINTVCLSVDVKKLTHFPKY